MKKGFSLDQRGVEPTVMKLMAGVILLAIGLGMGISIYIATTRTAQLTFQVIVSPGSATIGRPTSGENAKNVSVSIERLGDYDKLVTLGKTGVPPGVTVEFSPDNGVPTFGSTMTITVENTASSTWTGTCTITIKATGGDGVEKTASFELTVE